MMRTKWGWWLVASPVSRMSYAVSKAVLFTLGVAMWSFHIESLLTFGVILYLTLTQCVIRGIYAIAASAQVMNLSA
jgi:hypothetical protein